MNGMISSRTCPITIIGYDQMSLDGDHGQTVTDLARLRGWSGSMPPRRGHIFSTKSWMGMMARRWEACGRWGMVRMKWYLRVGCGRRSASGSFSFSFSIFSTSFLCCCSISSSQSVITTTKALRESIWSSAFIITVKVSFRSTNRITAVSCLRSLSISAIGPCFISHAPSASAWMQFSSLIFSAASFAIAIDSRLPSRYSDSRPRSSCASSSHLASLRSMISRTFCGARARLARICSISASGADFFCSATSVAKRITLSTWWKKLLVAATQTSRPTLMQMGKSTLRASVEPSTLMMPMVFTLARCLQSPTMLIRSLVSPDWLISTTVSFSVMSEGSISTGSTMLTLRKQRSRLKKYSPAQAAQQLDPQASMVRKSPNSMAFTRSKSATKGISACCRISQLYQWLNCAGGRSSTFCGSVMWNSRSRMRSFSCGISVTFSSKTSWSQEGKQQFTCFSKAMRSDTTRISSSSAEKPISSGEPLVAVQIVSGAVRSMITSPHCDFSPALLLNSSSACSMELP